MQRCDPFDKNNDFTLEVESQSSPSCGSGAVWFPQRVAGEDGLWETVFMPKRDLRIVKWMGSTPAIGVCEFCSRQFKTPMSALTRTADAQANLQEQFDRHKCKREDASQTAVRIVGEATKD